MRHGQGFSEQILSVFSDAYSKSTAEADGVNLPSIFEYNEADYFSTAAESHDNCSLLDLILRLSNNIHKAGAKHDHFRRSTIPAGFVYLAQFAIHDMVATDTVKAIEQFDTRKAKNRSSISLDLNSLYGAGSRGTAQFFHLEPGTGNRTQFRLGRMNATNPEKGYIPDVAEDIPRLRLGPMMGCPKDPVQFEPMIADVRNADNLIVSQLTVLFMKLHNKVYENLSDNPDRFDETRSIVTSIYRNIIRNELLPTIVDQNVLDEYRQLKSVSELPGSGNEQEYTIPVECVFAGLRFGHSMVRDSYHFNSTHGGFSNSAASLTGLLDFMGQTTDVEKHLPIRNNWVIDWARFFNLDGLSLNEFDVLTSKINLANKISPAIVRTLQTHEAVKLTPQNSIETGGDVLGLAFRTLAKGLKFELPTGQAIYKKFTANSGVLDKHLDEDELYNILNSVSYELEDQNKKERLLEKPDIEFLSKHTPLFVYVLAEAHIQENGNKLGFIGSHLVCHSFFGALLNPNSLNVDVDVKNYLPSAPNTIAELIDYCAA